MAVFLSAQFGSVHYFKLNNNFMFGIYRTLLALMVVSQHLAGIHVLGAYAVFGFYILSGYLMTSILHKNYGYSYAGIRSYGLNRFLRIYPMYWISILCSVLLIFVLGKEYVVAYHEAMFIPQNGYEYFKNIFLFFPVVESPRLTPSAWALTVELCFYILIGLGLSKTRVMVLGWLGLSIVYHIAANILNWGWENIYFSIPAASLPFALGAFLFHYNSHLLNWLRLESKVVLNILPLAIFALIIANWYLGAVTGYSRSLCFYINCLLCVFMVLLLSVKAALAFIPKKFDKWVGDLSYPIYVIHYQVGLIVMAFFNEMDMGYKRPDAHILLLSIPVVILVAWLLVIFVEKPVERIRSKIRPISVG